MLQAIDVANFFVDVANNDEEEYMTNLRVNKLTYFAQAYSLIRLGRPLFEEDIKAWRFGPVIPSVYQAFQTCGRDRIKDVFGSYDVSRFSDEELELLVDIMREYGKYSVSALVDLTHKPGAPWSRVDFNSFNDTITKESMKEYYSENADLVSFTLPEEGPDIYVGRRDETDGVLILPKEYDDE